MSARSADARGRNGLTMLHALTRLMVALSIAAGLGLHGRAAQPSPASPPRPAEVIAFARLTADARIPLTFAPGAVATDDGVWVPAGSGIVRIDMKTNVAGTPLALPSPVCASLVVAFGSVWAPMCGAGTVARVDVKTLAVTAPLTIGIADPPSARVVTAVGSLWIASDQKGVVSRVDPDTNDVVAEVFVARDPAAVAFGEEALWISSARGDVVTRVNPHTNAVVETVKVGPRPGVVAVGEGGVWTLNRGDGSVSHVDPKTNTLVATIPVEGAGAGDLAVGEGSVWVSAPGVPLVRIDPKTNRAAQRFTGVGGGAVLVAHGSVWVSAGPATTWRLDPVLITAMRPE